MDGSRAGVYRAAKRGAPGPHRYDAHVTANEPGERRRLAQPPSARYVQPGEAAAATGSPLRGPLVRAVVAAALGTAALVLVGAVLASTFGLLFVAAAFGAASGLLLARAAVPAEPGASATSRRTVSRLAIGIALIAVAAADVGLWLYARGEGGTLGLVDYLWTTFGPFVPGVAVVAVVAAAWGASAGPVQR